MSGFKILHHKGKEIIYIDYRNQGDDGMIKTANDLREWLLKENRAHLRLVNITGAFAKPEFTKLIRRIGEESKHIPVKGAIVGITGGKKALLMIYNKILGGELRPFDKEEDALNYLVS